MSSIALTSDPLVTAAAGLTEYNGTALFFTPMGTQRGVVPAEQFFRLNADLVGSNVTTAQNIFGVGVTLTASTVYQFESVFAFNKTAGTTSHTIGLGFGGTATLNNIAYRAINKNDNTSLTSTTTGSTKTFYIQTAASTIITDALTSAANHTIVYSNGTVSINAGGTFIPQYTLSAAPGGAYSTVAGSYMKISPIGTSGANTSVGTWA